MSSEQRSVPGSPSRIDMADTGELSEAQQAVFARIVAGKRKKVVGPLRVALHSPELADRWQAFGEFLRFGSSLPLPVSELAIIATGRHWNCQVEWAIHSKIAAEAGLSPEVIETIRSAGQPGFSDQTQFLAYEYVRELLEFGQVSDDSYQALLAAVGTVPVVELTALVGYYSMVAMTLNAHHVPVPADDMGSRLPLPADAGLRHPTPLGPGRLLDESAGKRDD